MALKQTQLKGRDVGDGSMGRADLNVTLAGEAVIRKMIDVASSGVKISSSTGVDPGTGDVGMILDWTLLDTRWGTSLWAKNALKPVYNTSEVAEVANLYYTDLRVNANAKVVTAYNHSQVVHDKTLVGLNLVDNTADINKSVAYAASAGKVVNYIPHASTNADSTSNNFYTSYGYISLGPMNAGGSAHIYTGQTNFYFNKEIQVNGETVYHLANLPAYPTRASLAVDQTNNTADANKSVNYATSAGYAGNAGNANTFSTTRSTYKGTTDAAVVGQLMWKNYGNGHTIFDASNATSPTGTAINGNNSEIAWAGTYPTLMGWNGANTYGVRVDVCRLADSATMATDSQNLGGLTPGYYSFHSLVSPNIDDNTTNLNGYTSGRGYHAATGTFPAGLETYSLMANLPGNGATFQQLAWSSGGEMYTRVKYGGTTFSSWRKVWDDYSFNPAAYLLVTAPSFAGNASTAYKLKYTGLFDANALTGGGSMSFYGQGGISLLNTPGWQYGSVFQFNSGDETLALQLGNGINHNSQTPTADLYFRSSNNLGWKGDWKTVLYNYYPTVVTFGGSPYAGFYPGAQPQADLKLTLLSTTAFGAGVGSTLSFAGRYRSDQPYQIHFATISGLNEGSGDYFQNGYLSFATNKDAVLTQRLRLDEVGGYFAGCVTAKSLSIGQQTNGTATIDAYGSFAYFGCNGVENGMKIGPNGNATVNALIVNSYSTTGIAVQNPAGSYARLHSLGIANGVHHATVSVNGRVDASTNNWIQDNGTVPSWMIVLNATDDIFQIKRGGAGTTSASYMYEKFTLSSLGNGWFSGDLTTGGKGTFSGGGFNSLRELKNVHKDWVGNALNVISKFKIRDFNYKTRADYDRTLGFIVDEIPKEIGDYALSGEERNAVNTYTLHGLSFKGLQEVKTKLDVQAGELDWQSARIIQLEKKIMELEGRLN